MKSIRMVSSALVLALFASGCHRPTAVDRDNQRVVETILTDITLKNRRLLEESARRAIARHEAGQVSDEEYEELDAIINKARGGDWSGAERDAYVFRKQHLFVKSGQ